MKHFVIYRNHVLFIEDYLAETEEVALEELAEVLHGARAHADEIPSL